MPERSGSEIDQGAPSDTSWHFVQLTRSELDKVVIQDWWVGYSDDGLPFLETCAELPPIKLVQSGMDWPL
jgi:hypothetical protein